MIAISVILGTLPSTVRPSASRLAAISLRAEFFAPTTGTSPANRAPPCTRIRSVVDTVTAVIVGSPAAPRPGGRNSPVMPTLGVMAVHLTRIYTRTGDAGVTALGDGSRVPKTDPRIEAYADVDETNAALGVALALGGLTDEVSAVLTSVQNDLFDVGADLCAPIVPDPAWPRL